MAMMNPGTRFRRDQPVERRAPDAWDEAQCLAIFYKPDFYELDPKTEQIDFDSVRRKAHEVNLRRCFAVTALTRIIDFKRS